MGDKVECPQCQKTLKKVRDSWECPHHGIVYEKGQLFISYSHQDALEFVRRLYKDLKKCTKFHIWHDEPEIKEGDLWDVHIEKAIQISSAVAAAMTECSLKEESVCRDEVAYAFIEKKRLLPLKVSPEVRPPLLLCRRSWIDFSKGYKEGLSSLLRFLKGDNSVLLRPPFNLISGTKPLDFGPEIASFSARFTGRRWLTRKLNRWLKTSKENMFVIVGEPGVGKSAFAARLCITKPKEVVGIHFCTHYLKESTNPFSFVASLAGQFCSTLDGFKEEIEKSEPDQMRKDAEDAFRHLIIEPVRKIAAPKGNKLVIVDSIDQASMKGREAEGKDSEEVAIVDLLVKQRSFLPSWLRIIATTRPEKRILNEIRGLHPFQLKADKRDNLKDLNAFISKRLEESDLAGKAGKDKERISARLNYLAAGNFLYTKYVLKELALGNFEVEDLGKLTQDLKDFYSMSFETRFKNLDEYSQKYAPLLQILAVAQAPLSIDFLGQATGWKRRDVNLRLNILRIYLREFGGEETESYSLFHRSLQDWLINRKAAGLYWCDAEEGHEQIADVLLENWQASDYAINYLFAHLLGVQRWQDLERLLTDIEYLKIKQRPEEQYKFQKEFEGFLQNNKIKVDQLVRTLENLVIAVNLIKNRKEKADWLDTFAYWINSTKIKDDQKRLLALKKAANKFDYACGDVSKELAEEYLNEGKNCWALRFAELHTWVYQRAEYSKRCAEACQFAASICLQEGMEDAFRYLGRAEFVRLRALALTKLAEREVDSRHKAEYRAKAHEAYKELNDIFSAVGKRGWKLRVSEWKKYEEDARKKLYPASQQKSDESGLFKAKVVSNVHDCLSAMYVIQFLEDKGGLVEWIHHERFKPDDFASNDTLFTVLIGGPKSPGISEVAEKFYEADKKGYLRMYSGLYCEASRLKKVEGKTHCYMLGGISKVNTLMAAYNFTKDVEVIKIIRKKKRPIFPVRKTSRY